MVKFALFALVALVVILMLKQYHPEYALITAICSGGILLIFILLELLEPLRTLLDTLTSYGVERGLCDYVIKAAGICIATNFSVGLCADFGQSSLAEKVQMTGKVALLILSLPILQNILEVGFSLL